MKAYPSSLNQPRAVRKIQYNRWILGLLLALVAHYLILQYPGMFLPKFSAPARVDLVDVSPEKLDAIRRQWKDRPILLNTDPTAKDPAAKSPENARYDSDRNKTVPKEQRARVTNVIPKPGTATGMDQAVKSKSAVEKNVSRERVQTENPEKKIALKNLSNFALRPEDSPSTLNARRRQQQNASAAAPNSQSNTDSNEMGESARGGDQALLDQDLPEGDRNILNTQESRYYSFYARIHETIGPLWQSLVGRIITSKPFNGGEYLTRVEIVLDADGTYVESRILQSSGSRDLDQVIHEAWKRIGRFPNPPRDLLDGNGQVRMGWTFNVRLDQQTGVQFAPPRRTF